MSGISKFKRIYSEGVVDYTASEEMEESVKIRRGVLRGSESQVSRTTGPGALTPDAAAQLGPKAVELQKTRAKQVDVPSFVKRVKKEEFEMDESLKTENPCWKGYKSVGVKMKRGRKVPNCVPEEFELGEAHMTASNEKKEAALRDRYDNTGMKAKFIKEYGEKEGTKYYFATIRKQAMKEYFELDEAPVQNDVEDEGAQDETQNRVSSVQDYLKQRAQQEARRKLILKARQVAQEVEAIPEDYNYELDEAKLSKTEKQKINIEKDKKRTRGGPRYDSKGRRLIRGKTRIYDWDRALGGPPTARIHVVNKNTGEIEDTLSDTEHYKHHEEGKLKPHQEYKYTEFDDPSKIPKGGVNPHIIRRVKKEIKRGKPISVVTARRGVVAPGMAKTLERHGIPAKRVKMHFTGDMPRHITTPKRKSTVFKHILKNNPAGGEFTDDYAPNVEAARKHPKLKAFIATPNTTGKNKGKVMRQSYRQQREEFELWVNALLDEGYDLSEFTIDELYEGYEELLDEADTDMEVILEQPRGLNYVSPYGKKEVKEEVVEVSPYDFWKSFIGEEAEQVEESVIEESVEVIERTPTSYDYWKAKLEENAGSVDVGEKDAALRTARGERNPNQKTTTISTSSRPGSGPSTNAPISIVPHIHTPTSKIK